MNQSEDEQFIIAYYSRLTTEYLNTLNPKKKADAHGIVLGSQKILDDNGLTNQAKIKALEQYWTAPSAQDKTLSNFQQVEKLDKSRSAGRFLLGIFLAIATPVVFCALTVATLGGLGVVIASDLFSKHSMIKDGFKEIFATKSERFNKEIKLGFEIYKHKYQSTVVDPAGANKADAGTDDVPAPSVRK